MDMMSAILHFIPLEDYTKDQLFIFKPVTEKVQSAITASSILEVDDA